MEATFSEQKQFDVVKNIRSKIIPIACYIAAWIIVFGIRLSMFIQLPSNTDSKVPIIVLTLSKLVVVAILVWILIRNKNTTVISIMIALRGNTLDLTITSAGRNSDDDFYLYCKSDNDSTVVISFKNNRVAAEHDWYAGKTIRIKFYNKYCLLVDRYAK